MKKYIVSLTAASMLLTPALTMAATETKASAADISEEELLDVLEQDAVNEAIPMMDRGGGGTSYYPGPLMQGVTVDASVTKETTPDFVAVNGYCDITRPTREAVRDALNQLFIDIKNSVGTDGRVRKSGSISVYPVYGPMGLPDDDSFNGSLSILVRVLNHKSAQKISDIIEEKGCSVNWDVRLNDAQEFELDVLDQLTTRLNKRKVVFEKLLKKKLTKVSGASISTWADGYSTYDPEMNTVEATTTLSVTFDIGTRAALPTTRTTRTAPKG